MIFRRQISSEIDKAVTIEIPDGIPSEYLSNVVQLLEEFTSFVQKAYDVNMVKEPSRLN
jgi:hypothetical protein